MKCTVLHKYGCNRASALIKASLNNSTLCGSVRVSLKLFHLCNKCYHFEEVIKAFLCLCRYRNTWCIAAPLLRNELILCELLLYILRICADLIHFIDSNNYRYACGFSMVDSLYCLRHNTVIGSNNKDCNICYLRTSCSHSSESLMTGGIKESDRLAVNFYSVSTNVLSNTACLACCNICMTDSVKN